MTTTIRKKKHDPWVPFRREVLRILRGLVSPPVEVGTAVSVETVTGVRVEGEVAAATVLGIRIDTRGDRRSYGVYIPTTSIDLLDIGPFTPEATTEAGGVLSIDYPTVPTPPNDDVPDPVDPDAPLP